MALATAELRSVMERQPRTEGRVMSAIMLRLLNSSYKPSRSIERNFPGVHDYFRVLQGWHNSELASDLRTGLRQLPNRYPPGDIKVADEIRSKIHNKRTRDFLFGRPDASYRNGILHDLAVESIRDPSQELMDDTIAALVLIRESLLGEKKETGVAECGSAVNRYLGRAYLKDAVGPNYPSGLNSRISSIKEIAASLIEYYSSFEPDERSKSQKYNKLYTEFFSKLEACINCSASEVFAGLMVRKALDPRGIQGLNLELSDTELDMRQVDVLIKDPGGRTLFVVGVKNYVDLGKVFHSGSRLSKFFLKGKELNAPIIPFKGVVITAVGENSTSVDIVLADVAGQICLDHASNYDAQSAEISRVNRGTQQELDRFTASSRFRRMRGSDSPRPGELFFVCSLPSQRRILDRETGQLTYIETSEEHASKLLSILRAV